MRPRLLDLFCAAGGATRGYQNAGFEVWGVDNRPQPRYIGDHFTQADVFDLEPWFLSAFDAIHASPPCQRWMQAQNFLADSEANPDLITPLRPILEAIGLPYVIENVPGAPLHDPVLICGSMFTPALDVKRHRHFETNWGLDPLTWPCRHKLWAPRFPTRAGKGKRRVVSVFGQDSPAPLVRQVMEMPWATRLECAQAIPPAYTELIGYQLLQHVTRCP